MVSTERLFTLGQTLANDAALARKVAFSLRTVAGLPSYEAWHAGTAQRQPFIPELETLAVTNLTHTGLVADGKLLVRVNTSTGAVFVTDGVWWDANTRVFPFIDETQMMIALTRRLGWEADLVSVLDLAGGCGHGAWLAGAPNALLLDVNPRALAYAELNRVLNALPPGRNFCALNDIRNGVPRPLISHDEELLVLANMPFGLTPFAGALPVTSDGGPSGMVL